MAVPAVSLPRVREREGKGGGGGRRGRKEGRKDGRAYDEEVAYTRHTLA